MSALTGLRLRLDRIADRGTETTLRSFACKWRAIMSGICIVDTQVVFALAFAFIFVFKCENRLNCMRRSGTKKNHCKKHSKGRERGGYAPPFTVRVYPEWDQSVSQLVGMCWWTLSTQSLWIAQHLWRWLDLLIVAYQLPKAPALQSTSTWAAAKAAKAMANMTQSSYIFFFCIPS